MIWSIEPIPLARALVPGPEVFFQRDFEHLVELVIYAFLLRTDDGGCLLVDTGLPAVFDDLNANIRARKGQRTGFHAEPPGLPEALVARDARPEAVVLTSFGPYAVGGLEQLPELPIHASARGLADLARPEVAELAHPLPEPQGIWLRERALTVAGESEIRPGVTALEVGVHHPASMAVLVETAAGRVAIADPVFTRANLERGIALGAAEHVAGWHPMVRDLTDRARFILPSHDPDPRPVEGAAICSAWADRGRS